MGVLVVWVCYGDVGVCPPLRRFAPRPPFAEQKGGGCMCGCAEGVSPLCPSDISPASGGNPAAPPPRTCPVSGDGEGSDTSPRGGYSCRSLGSQRSRSQSPVKLRERTRRNMAMPGIVEIHHAVSR